MKLYTIFSRITILSLLIAFQSSWGQSNQASGTFNLQGRLTAAAGGAVADGSHSLAITVYNKAGQVIMTEMDNVTTVDGIFSTMIGDNVAGSLKVDATTDYELGVKLDGGTELAPRIPLGSSLQSLTADLAANANAVGGFAVSTSANPLPNTVVALNANGKLPSSILDAAGGLVSSINGIGGAVTIQGGGDLSVNTVGSTISLAFTGGASGSLTYPYLRSVDLPLGSAFAITNTGGATTGSFINSGSGTALNASTNSTLNAAITATNTGSGAALNASANSAANAAITATNNSGEAISAISSAANDAVLRVKNTASAATAKLIDAVNSTGTVVLDVAANGKTTITSTVGDALTVTTSASGSAALNLTGGLTVSGPVGTGTIASGQLLTTVTNTYAKANSIILITVNGGGAAAVPLRVASQGTGSFVVSVFNGLGAVTADVTFNYLIINQ